MFVDGAKMLFYVGQKIRWHAFGWHLDPGSSRSCTSDARAHVDVYAVVLIDSSHLVRLSAATWPLWLSHRRSPAYGVGSSRPVRRPVVGSGPRMARGVAISFAAGLLGLQI